MINASKQKSATNLLTFMFLFFFSFLWFEWTVKPKVKVVNQILGALVGNDATLDCQIEASPKPVNIWRNENGDVLISSSKYQILEKIDSYDIQLSLRIRNVESKDFGTYNCSAKNILGESESSIQLIGK